MKNRKVVNEGRSGRNGAGKECFDQNVDRQVRVDRKWRFIAEFDCSLHPCTVEDQVHRGSPALFPGSHACS